MESFPKAAAYEGRGQVPSPYNLTWEGTGRVLVQWPATYNHDAPGIPRKVAELHSPLCTFRRL